MSGRARTVLIVARDLLLRARFEAAARDGGLEIAPDADAEPSIVLVDLDDPDGVDKAVGLRERLPDARVIGFVSHVDQATKAEARGWGVEVHPRGASRDLSAILRAR